MARDPPLPTPLETLLHCRHTPHEYSVTVTDLPPLLSFEERGLFVKIKPHPQPQQRDNNNQHESENPSYFPKTPTNPTHRHTHPQSTQSQQSP